ncbi:hypothetical protein B0H10DRAFT_1098332 [Mycena sp. CBHHK59/15]|nr:hypothetical protein B0H10DRAFT_1098332 [Mycena sp. CBHHK59/15]
MSHVASRGATCGWGGDVTEHERVAVGAHGVVCERRGGRGRRGRWRWSQGAVVVTRVGGDPSGRRVGSGAFCKDWLARAGLTTFSRTPRVFPRPICLLHYFSVHAFGEDYHALPALPVRHRRREARGAQGGPGQCVRRVPGRRGVVVEGLASSPRAIRCRSLRPAAHIRARGRAPAARAADNPERLARVVPRPNPDPHDAGLGDGVSEGLGRLLHEIRHERRKRLGRSPLSGADEKGCGGYAERGGVCPARA